MHKDNQFEAADGYCRFSSAVKKKLIPLSLFNSPESSFSK